MIRNFETTNSFEQKRIRKTFRVSSTKKIVYVYSLCENICAIKASADLNRGEIKKKTNIYFLFLNCYIGTPKRTRSFYTTQTFYKTEELLVCWTYSWILVCYNLLHFDLLMTLKLFSHRTHRTTSKQLSCLRTTSKQIQLGGQKGIQPKLDKNR